MLPLHGHSDFGDSYRLPGANLVSEVGEDTLWGFYCPPFCRMALGSGVYRTVCLVIAGEDTHGGRRPELRQKASEQRDACKMKETDGNVSCTVTRFKNQIFPVCLDHPKNVCVCVLRCQGWNSGPRAC